MDAKISLKLLEMMMSPYKTKKLSGSGSSGCRGTIASGVVLEKGEISLGCSR